MILPGACPFMTKCDHKVTVIDFQEICMSPKWISCPYIPDEVREEITRKPIQWLRDLKSGNLDVRFVVNPKGDVEWMK